jgi:hypothetical protein
MMTTRGRIGFSGLTRLYAFVSCIFVVGDFADDFHSSSRLGDNLAFPEVFEVAKDREVHLLRVDDDKFKGLLRVC